MTERTCNVLFLCTGNSARSVLAEVLLNSRGAGLFRAFSAGSRPVGRVNPYAIEVLQQAGLPTDGLRSKSWDEFAQPGPVALDFVFTVCDSAASEVCPIWPGQPVTAHWGLPYPAPVQGSDADKLKAFHDTFVALDRRIGLFTRLDISGLDQQAIKRRLAEIGRGRSPSSPGTTTWWRPRTAGCSRVPATSPSSGSATWSFCSTPRRCAS